MGRRRVLPRASLTRRRLLRLYDRLHRRFGPQGGGPGRPAFELIVGAILTHGVVPVNAEAAIPRLRAAGALSPMGLAGVPARRLAALLRPAGHAPVQAGRLRAFAQHLARHHGGRLRRLLVQPVADLRLELLAIPGSGRETADSILLHAAGRPVFVVDAATRRVLTRHRLVPPDADRATLQATVMAELPRDPGLFQAYHVLLARVAREHCRARPHCAGCPLRFDLRGRPPAAPGRG